MANLLEIAELTYRQIFPNPREKTAITLEEFVATAKVEYAAAMWIYHYEMINVDGFFQMPSDLISETELDVENKRIDVSSLKYLASLPGDLWIQSLGTDECDCKLIKTTIALWNTLCDDDSLPDNVYPYYLSGKSILFPKGVPRSVKKMKILYASMGNDLDENMIEVNDYIASKVRDKLGAIYGKRVPADTTNNQNTDN